MPSCLSCPPQRYLAMIINWKPTTGLILFQVQSGPAHEPWMTLGRQRLWEHYGGQAVKGIYSIRCLYIWFIPPSASYPNSSMPVHGYQLDTCYWTYTMPDWARTCTWTTVSIHQAKGTGKHNALLKGCLCQLGFGGFEQNLILYVWKLIFANVPL